VYVPHNDQLGRTDFPHNALSPQCIVGTYRCVCVCVCETARFTTAADLYRWHSALRSLQSASLPTSRYKVWPVPWSCCQPQRDQDLCRQQLYVGGLH